MGPALAAEVVKNWRAKAQQLFKSPATTYRAVFMRFLAARPMIHV
jgi:hypothetical protein